MAYAAGEWELGMTRKAQPAAPAAGASSAANATAAGILAAVAAPGKASPGGSTAAMDLAVAGGEAAGSQKAGPVAGPSPNPRARGRAIELVDWFQQRTSSGRHVCLVGGQGGDRGAGSVCAGLAFWRCAVLQASCGLGCAAGPSHLPAGRMSMCMVCPRPVCQAPFITPCC